MTRPPEAPFEDAAEPAIFSWSPTAEVKAWAKDREARLDLPEGSLVKEVGKRLREPAATARSKSA